MSDNLATGAREAIRIAEKYEPADLTRQRDMARDIIGAINLCEAELAAEIIVRINSQAKRP